jgi:hypothetical protein
MLLCLLISKHENVYVLTFVALRLIVTIYIYLRLNFILSFQAIYVMMLLLQQYVPVINTQLNITMDRSLLKA